MHKRSFALVALLLSAALLTAACGGGDGGGGGGGGGGGQQQPPEDKPASGPLTYTAVDFGFQGPETVATGAAEVTLKNDGKEPHQMIVVQLLQGKTVDDAIKFIKEQGISGPPPPWIKQIRPPGIGKPVKPGGSGTGQIGFAKPGNYVALCFVPSKEDKKKSHAELGMVYPITVEA
jgi:hypothetical protein